MRPVTEENEKQEDAAADKTVEAEKKVTIPKGLILLYSMDSLSRAGRAMFRPVLVVYVLALGGTILHLGEMLAVFGIAYSISGFVVSKKFLSRRYRVMVLSYGLLTLYSFALLMTRSIEFLYFVVLLGGVAASLKTPAISRISFDHVDRDLYVKASAFYRFLIAGLTALSGYIGAAIIHHSESPLPHENGDLSVFRFLFITMMVLFGTSFFYSLVYSARYKHHAKPSSD